MDHRRMLESSACLQTVKSMGHLAAHPIRFSSVFVATLKKADFSRSTIKVHPCDLCILTTLTQKCLDIIHELYFAFSIAYRLQFCLPPPIIPNAEILMASKEFKIGMCNMLTLKMHTHLVQNLSSARLGCACGRCQCMHSILNIDPDCQFIFRLERLSLIMFPE